MHDSRVMWFYYVFGVTVIKSHLCVYSYIFFNLTPTSEDALLARLDKSNIFKSFS